MTSKASSKKTPQSRTKKQTVAEEAPPEEGARAHEDEAVAEPATEVVEEPAPTLEPEPAASNSMVDVAHPKGFCDNHPDRDAVLVVNFPWTKTQRFCNLDIPRQYRYLMP